MEKIIKEAIIKFDENDLKILKAICNTNSSVPKEVSEFDEKVSFSDVENFLGNLTRLI